jgi:TIR domain
MPRHLPFHPPQVVRPVSGDPIDVALVPSQLVEGAPTDGQLRVRNVGALPCTNVLLELEAPRALRLESGRRAVEIDRLEPGAHHDHPLRIRPTSTGTMALIISYLSFRDGLGSTHYENDLVVGVEVVPAPTSASPELPTSPGGRTSGRPAETASVFISHRRADSGHFADRLVERLREHLPGVHLFLDYDGVRPGDNFRHRLDRELQVCSVVLVLIGPRWLTITSPRSGRRRLDEDDDVVFREVATGLASDLVLPVLFDSAAAPRREELPPAIRSLADRQAFEVGRRHFDADVHELALLVRDLLRDRRRKTTGDGTPERPESAPA